MKGAARHLMIFGWGWEGPENRVLQTPRSVRDNIRGLFVETSQSACGMGWVQRDRTSPSVVLTTSWPVLLQSLGASFQRFETAPSMRTGGVIPKEMRNAHEDS
ncbi:hypothetical protein D8B26_002593 [Coccidioides posadasii str. Silveira]|uniref:uncharacterized protein n=1 Tax=Coccidioides posadasii (strain RMSCC 757 / Silveira) TaxID=443226 RepID=UPI001BEF608C|nr:hypothetical protein D8B26_002593 [Coccidioides posadasii str. Silveira]